MRSAIAFLVVFSSAAAAQARDIYVNNLAGDDALSGRAPRTEGRDSGPVKTIAKATRLATPGDRIVLAKTSEPYREQVALQGGKCSGVSENVPFVFEGNGAVIDGSIPVADDAWESVGGDLFRFAPEVKSHQVLLLDGQPARRVAATPDGGLPALAPLDWCLLRGVIYFRTEAGRVPQDYFPACAGAWTGITLYDVHDVVVQNVSVRGFAFDGINAHDKAFNARLEGVLLESNGRSGISVGGASRVSLLDCHVQGSFEAQLRTEGFSHTHIAGCRFDATTAPEIVRHGGEVERD
jgi:hypothetical protein